MRIAQVAHLYESGTPNAYSGTERIVSYLTEELVRQGHAVTLFASGDSETQARLVPICPKSLRLDEACIDRMAHHVLMLEKVLQRSSEFDVIHFHVDYLHFPISRHHFYLHLTTLHGRLDLPDLVPLYEEFHDMPLVSISDSQRKPLAGANWRATVYHGLPADLHKFQPAPGDYLAFLGRISPEKGVERAIEIATRAGMPLKIAAKVDAADKQYFEQEIKHLLDNPLVEFLGEIDESGKASVLGNAYALLFPIAWPEPFGLVMIEAMACGTPVIAFPHGSVPEVMVDGVTGFVVDTIDAAVEAVHQVRGLSRARCHRVFTERFSAARMASDYVRVYEDLQRQAIAQRRQLRTPWLRKFFRPPAQNTTAQNTMSPRPPA